MSTALAVSSPELVGQINAEHKACEASYSKSLEHAVKCGEMLYEVRKDIQTGDWKNWLDENFEASQRTADGYMQLYYVHEQNPQLLDEANGSMSAAFAYIGRQAGGARDLSLDEPAIVDAEVVQEPTYALTLGQLVDFAQKRWHRKPDEERVLAWLQAEGHAE